VEKTLVVAVMITLAAVMMTTMTTMTMTTMTMTTMTMTTTPAVAMTTIPTPLMCQHPRRLHPRQSLLFPPSSHQQMIQPHAQTMRRGFTRRLQRTVRGRQAMHGDAPGHSETKQAAPSPVRRALFRAERALFEPRVCSTLGFGFELEPQKCNVHIETWHLSRVSGFKTAWLVTRTQALFLIDSTRFAF
jgi:hypothetical protein